MTLKASSIVQGFLFWVLLGIIPVSAQQANYDITGLNLDGVNDYVQAPNGAVTIAGLSNGTSAFYTTQAFVKFDAIAATGYKCIFYNGNSAANGFGLYTYNGKFAIIVGGKFQYNTTAFTPVTGKWYHLALKFNLARDANGTYYGSFTVWVDGVNLNPSGAPGYNYIITNSGLGAILNAPAATESFFIGGKAGAENIAASFDQVSVVKADVNYNDAHCLLSPSASLLRYYTFAEGTVNGNNVGKTVTDRSGNSKTGNLLNLGLTDANGLSNYTFGVPSLGSNTRIYVNKNATGANTGDSWANAFTNLHDALAVSCTQSNHEIWMAEGTYKPNRDWYGVDNGRKNTFFVRSNVKIYGGFMGNETNLAERMPGHSTILSGNQGLENDETDNAYHIMFIRDGLNTVWLDGLVIQDGFANSSSIETLPTITVDGASNGSGAGIWSSSALTITNSVFSNNKCTSTGGGIYMNPYGGALTCRQVVFTKNEAPSGGGFYFYASSPLELTNCTFFNNKGSFNGGAFSRLFFGGTPNPLPALNITNCIFNSNLGGNPIYSTVQAPNATYSNIQTQTISITGTGVNNANPLFINASSPIGPDSLWMTNDDGLQINSCGLIDKGSNTAVAAIPTDIINFTRKFDVNAITDGGEGTGAKVDMGAYERNLTFAGPGKISVGSLTMPSPPEEMDTVRSVIDPGAFPNAVFSWQKDENLGLGWQPIPLDSFTVYLPLDSLKRSTKFRRVTTICGNNFYSDTVSIKVIKPDGGFSGQVLSKNGFPVKGIEIQVKKKSSLPGSPAAFMYRDTTGDDGRYSIGPVYYGDPDASPSTVFEIRPIKDGHEFNILVLERTLTSAFKTFTDVNFVDNTVFSISGSTIQKCADCLLENNTTGTQNCPINDVNMRVNGGFQVKSTILDGQQGRYSITITDPKEYTFSARFRTRDFLPKDTAINVTGNITGLVFSDTTTRLITGRVSAGCSDNLGTSTLEFRDTGSVSCFRKMVVTDNLGNFSVRLPARAYRAEIKDITLKAGSTDNKPDVMNFFTSILPKDSLFRDITDRDTTLFIVFQRPPTMVVVDGLDPVNDCAPIKNQFALIPQLTERPIRIKVYQGTVAQNCPANDTTLKIFTNIQVEDVNEELVYRTINGDVKDTLTGGNPNIIAPYYKTFNPVFKDVFGREVSLTRKVVVTGVKANIGTFTTISPEVPLLVLHDPPGDRSKSSWSQSVSNQTTLRMYVGKTQGAELWSQIKIGTAFSAGLGFSVPTKIWGSIGGTFGVSQKMNTVNESTITTTTTQTYATSDDPGFTGDNGDLFVGGALNLRYSAADELSYDPDSCKLSLRKTLAVGNEGFATTYNYTKSFIEKTLIPEQLANSTNPSLTPAQRDNFANSVKVWQQVLANNEANKKRAKFESNRSFSAGSTNTFTSTSRSSKTSTIQFDMEINTQLALELGVDIGGSGFSGGTKVRMKMESGQSQTGVVTNETTTSYTLQDDDAGDNFSVDVKRDPVYNTPVFELVAGTSSCPTEPGTRPRGEMQLVAEEPTKSGIAPDGEALFFLKLGNTSQSNEARTYRLSFVQASNPNCAIITIGGSPILTGIDYNIAYLGEVQVAVSVKKNPASTVFSYEGLEFVLADACGGNISKTAKLSAYFNSPCSPVTLTAPQNGWVANSLINNLLPITFKDYVVANLQTISLEYSPVGSNSWITAFSRNSAQLPNSANGAEVNWNITNVADGEYNLRLKLVCATGTIYSERVTGVIDRVGPLVLGKPDPTDDEFINGDLIGARFIETIHTASLGDGKVRLIRAKTGQRISSTVTGYVNQLVMVPNESISQYAGESFWVILEGVKDVYGNQRAIPDTFRFKVGGRIPSTADNAVNLGIRNQNIPENAGAPVPPPGGGKASPLGGNDTAIVVVFELPVNTPIPVRINYSIGGTAIYLQDYKIILDSVAASASNSFDGSLGSIVIAAGTKKAVLRIRPVDNNGFNPDKTIFVSLLEGGDYELGGAVQVKGVIVNEEEPIKYIFTGNGNFSDVNQWQDGNKVSTRRTPSC